MDVDDKAWELLMLALGRIEKKLDKINGRVFCVEKWKSKVMGGAAVISVIVGVVIKAVI